MVEDNIDDALIEKTWKFKTTEKKTLSANFSPKVISGRGGSRTLLPEKKWWVDEKKKRAIDHQEQEFYLPMLSYLIDVQ